jgi:hypothetical protein
MGSLPSAFAIAMNSIVPSGYRKGERGQIKCNARRDGLEQSAEFDKLRRDLNRKLIAPDAPLL